MSTESLSQYKEDLSVEAASMDMTEEFTPEEIAGCVIDIATKLGTREGRVVDYTLIKFSDRGNKDYQIRVNNKHQGFVSVSDDCGTGVSNTLYYPYFSDDDGCFSGLVSLMEMINEAWYSLHND